MQRPALLIDIFCHVIDNYGDIGVSWRLAQQLALWGHRVRLIANDVSALQWMSSAPKAFEQVQLLDWQALPRMAANVVIEMFGCELPMTYVELIAEQAQQNRVIRWINLEYLSAEKYTERCHLLPSPIMHGPAQGLSKTFFYPGFSNRTGGLLRETNLPERQAIFNKKSWLSTHKIEWRNERIVSLFCYEPMALAGLLQILGANPQPTLLLVTAGRATHAMRALQISSTAHLHIDYLPHLTQDDYDHLLWASDLNFVRGEDSLVRAIWARRPFIWQIYPQEDGAHGLKLDAFLTQYLENVEPAIAGKIVALHHWWNDIGSQTPSCATCITDDLQDWARISETRCHEWQGLPNLAQNLLEYVNQ